MVYLIKTVKKILYFLNTIKFIFKKKNNDFGISRFKVFKASIWGFTPNEYAIYQLDRNSRKLYLRERERTVFRDKFKSNRIILDSKILFSNVMRNYIKINEIYAYKMQGKYITLVPGYDEESLHNKLQSQKLVFKLDNGPGGGSGFHLLSYKNGKYYDNNKETLYSEIASFIKRSDNYLIEEYCEQGTFENNLFPYSVNTLRIITVITPNNEIKVISAFQRMGAEEGVCVDNANAGGLYSEIDIETGKLDGATSHHPKRLFDKNHNLYKYKVHPVTGHPIENLVIPNWNNVKQTAIDLHTKLLFTGLKFIAWDFALTDNGITVIEGNVSCNYDLLQTRAGQRYGEIGNWMRSWGYIK